MDENTNVLASGADDGLVKVWDRRELRESRPRPVGELAGHVDGVAHVTSRGDGRHVASSSKDQSIKVMLNSKALNEGSLRFHNHGEGSTREGLLLVESGY